MHAKPFIISIENDKVGDNDAAEMLQSDWGCSSRDTTSYRAEDNLLIIVTLSISIIVEVTQEP